jgi:hypothetical protein
LPTNNKKLSFSNKIKTILNKILTRKNILDQQNALTDWLSSLNRSFVDSSDKCLLIDKLIEKEANLEADKKNNLRNLLLLLMNKSPNICL